MGAGLRSRKRNYRVLLFAEDVRCSYRQQPIASTVKSSRDFDSSGESKGGAGCIVITTIQADFDKPR